ncbi:2OG-Fe(II) oxygenase superfamily protein [Xylariaceae sp. FL0804]|nr:2OG-Fe(II) oxygenase superfamily protein [Xylariaceae sp. FL0804]
MPDTAPIPVINVSSEKQSEAQIAAALVDAAVDHGFVYIKYAGEELSAERVANAFNLSRALFDSPLEHKQRCKIQKNNQGWGGMHSETLDPKPQAIGDSKEVFNFGPFVDEKATQPIPPSMEPHQAELAAFREACHSLCRRLLLLFGIGLGVEPPDFFARAHSREQPSGSILRFLYYPPPPPPSSAATPDAAGVSSSSSSSSDVVRAGAHSDYGSVTLLFRLRGQAGLELLSARTGDWTPVPVCPPGTEADPAPPILVNIGDLLSYWTNGLLRSTVHRVTATAAAGAAAGAAAAAAEEESTRDPRYSLVFFCQPADQTPLTAVPSERVRGFRGGLADANAGNPYAERRVLTAAEHLQMRLQASYLQMYGKSPGEGA